MYTQDAEGTGGACTQESGLQMWRGGVEINGGEHDLCSLFLKREETRCVNSVEEN